MGQDAVHQSFEGQGSQAGGQAPGADHQHRRPEPEEGAPVADGAQQSDNRGEFLGDQGAGHRAAMTWAAI